MFQDISLYVRYSNQVDKHDKLCINFMEYLDFEKHPNMAGSFVTLEERPLLSLMVVCTVL